MSYFKCLFLLFTLFALSVSASTVPSSSVKNFRLPTSYALPGTTTAVVGIAIDKKGFPKETVKEIVLLPGQKVVFAGPDRFSIVFKDKKTFSGKIKYESSNGVISFAVPEKILDQPEYAEEFRKNKSITFNYSIFVNGKELDPPIIIKRDY